MSLENQPSNSYTTNEVTAKEMLTHEKASKKLDHAHEVTLKDQENNHTKELEVLRNTHEKTLKEKELGFIGKCFGGKELVSLNISGGLIIILILGGVILSIIVYNRGSIDDVIKIWGLITPLITLTLGYIFGSNDK